MKHIAGIVFGWWLMVGTSNSGLTVVPVPYQTKEDCELAAEYARENEQMDNFVGTVCVPGHPHVKEIVGNG